MSETKKGIYYCSTYRLQHGVCSWFGSEELTKTGLEQSALYQAGPGGTQAGADRKVGREREERGEAGDGHTGHTGTSGTWADGQASSMSLSDDEKTHQHLA